jgi:3-oxoacyl-[acyl-carrier-protein] synthase-3
MNGPKIAEFALSAVPRTVDRLLERAAIAREEIDLFVFHQANRYILEELQKVCCIPAEKFQITMEDSGNTSSSTIPIALKRAIAEGKLRDGMILMLVGFGVGLSLSATLVRWVSAGDAQ